MDSLGARQVQQVPPLPPSQPETAPSKLSAAAAAGWETACRSRSFAAAAAVAATSRWSFLAATTDILKQLQELAKQPIEMAEAWLVLEATGCVKRQVPGRSLSGHRQGPSLRQVLQVLAEKVSA